MFNFIIFKYHLIVLSNFLCVLCVLNVFELILSSQNKSGNIKKAIPYFLVFLLFSFKHPFYLSVTDLKYNIKEKTVQGSLKVFVNDFEIELSKVESRKIDLLHPKDSSLLKQQIGNYLLKHFKMNVNSNSLDYKILGFEKEEEAFWIYIESKVCPIPKTVNIENSILFETIKDQINIIQIEVNLNKQSFKQNHPQKNFNFVF